MTKVIKVFVFLASLLFHRYNISMQICPSPVPQKYQHMQSGSVVGAYFGNWDIYANDYQIENIQAAADKLTHLFYAFMKPDYETGRCVSHDIWADLGAYDDYQKKVGGNFAKMIELKQQFPHLKILLSIGGGAYNHNFIKLAQDRDKLFAFARSCVDMMDFYDHSFFLDGKQRTNNLRYEGLFDGLDIDWEWQPSNLTPELSKNYTDFLYELRRLLDLRAKSSGKDGMLTVGLQVTPRVYKKLELEKIAQVIDWYNVMAYDFFGSSSGTVGFNAPLCGKRLEYSVDGALHAIIQQGVSPDKMVLGLPLYGYVYEDCNGYNTAITAKNKIKALSYHAIQSEFFENDLFNKKWNTYEKVPSLYNKQDKIFITYDGKNSLIDKVKLAQLKRMQGVFLWRLACDDAQHSLVKAVSSAII